MRVMLDINVVLDIVGGRKPFYEASKTAFLKVVELGEAPFLAVHAYPTIYYLLGSAVTRSQRDGAMEWVFDSFSAAAIGPSEIAAARGLGMADFEDALVSAIAERCHMDYIITRNTRDYIESPVKALSPEEFLKL